MLSLQIFFYSINGHLEYWVCLMTRAEFVVLQETVRGCVCRGGSGDSEREYEILSQARSATDSSFKDNNAVNASSSGRGPSKPHRPSESVSWRRWPCSGRPSPEPCVQCSHNISNSSLKNVDRAAIRDELIEFLTDS